MEDDVERNGQVGGLWACLTRTISAFFRRIKETAEEDPRRVIHSFKVGLALTLVSTFYYVTPLFTKFNDSTIWSVMTVTIVMEFTVGATLTKGLNRGLATLIASALGVAAHYVAVQCGEKGEPFLLAVLVFLIAVAATFARFMPELSIRYDNGVVVFLITYCLVSLTSYRKENLILMACRRTAAIAIGVFIALFTSFMVFPTWAGENLHDLAVDNLEKMATYMEGLRDFYGEKAGAEELEDKNFLHGAKGLLHSRATEQSLLTFAKWEPKHGRFGFGYPWKQYINIGDVSRQCAYFMEVLHAYATKHETQAPIEQEMQKRIRFASMELTSASSNVLRELAASVRSMTTPSTAHHHIDMASAAVGHLKNSLSQDCIIAEVIQVATVVSLLVEIVGCSKQIVESVEELARSAKFKSREGVHAHEAKERPLQDDAQGSHGTEGPLQEDGEGAKEKPLQDEAQGSNVSVVISRE